MSITLLIPMSGQGVRYQKAGYKLPKPLIPVSGRPMIERLLEKIPTDWPCVFVMAENHEDTELPALLKKLRPQAKLLFVPPHTEGPAKAIRKGLEAISPDSRVLVSYCDYGLNWDARDFERFVKDSDCDFSVISYRGFHAHYLSPVPYAYSRVERNRILQVKEKGSFTDNRENEFASCGAYYFKTAKDLNEALDWQYQKNISLNGEFYTSLTVQALIEMRPEAYGTVYEIPQFFQWGTPEDLWIFEYWEKVFTRQIYLNGKENPSISQLLLPMAGLGSRFKGISEKLKPLIEIAGTPLYRRALESSPKPDKTVIVSLEKIKSELRLKESEKFIGLMETPSGQALTVEKGLPEMDLKKDVMVTACDHEIVLDPHKWQQLKAMQPDAVIFTVKGFPGAQRTPKSFAYVVPENDKEPLSLVKDVSVKLPISEKPSQDHLLVGTFWFRTGEILKNGIEELKKADLRVNGELYLDSVFKILIQNKMKVRIFELDGYINWGDPGSMSEALYWYEVFWGQRLQMRMRLPHGI